eukprot:Phypoly_transcript_12073.p1 GENE.Phypoly_transcript_12073~~Phypoly_transcript_12073.p1  ORF type:complete len:380 (-),score=62.95 Phypoly_transcript_12073:26-1090(-)
MAAAGSNPMLSMIASFDRNKMKQTKTRVRTSSGEIYEEQLRGGQLESTFVGNEGRPAYLEDSINGYSAIIPGKYDAGQGKWTNYIYNDNSTVPPTKDCINKISFITFNVWFWERYLKERALAFFGILEKFKPDFVCLQEVTGAFLEHLKTHPFIQSHYIISDFHGTTVIPYGTMILSHYPISSLRIYRLPTNQGRRYLSAEVVLEKNGGTSAKKINIGTIHLESCDNQEMRIEQLKTIFPLLNAYDHAFFMGDFNFPDGSEEETHTDPSKFRDVWKEMNKGYKGSEQDLTKSATTDRGRYDRLVYSSNIFQGAGACLIGTDPIIEISTKEEEVFPSDHKGLYVEFSTKSDCCRD